MTSIPSIPSILGRASMKTKGPWQASLRPQQTSLRPQQDSLRPQHLSISTTIPSDPRVVSRNVLLICLGKALNRACGATEVACLRAPVACLQFQALILTRWPTWSSKCLRPLLKSSRRHLRNILVRYTMFEPALHQQSKTGFLPMRDPKKSTVPTASSPRCTRTRLVKCQSAQMWARITTTPTQRYHCHTSHKKSLCRRRICQMTTTLTPGP